MTRAAGALGDKLVEAEMNLIDLRLTGTGQDGVRFGAKLISKLSYLANGAATGDFRPTNQHVEVQQILDLELRDDLRQIDAVLSQDLGTFNDQLKAKSLPTILDRAPPPRVQP